ncbi:MAG: hypothetical protein KJO31_01400 [Gammaproteobacteria bacterium]|nr:hypothetical protein [Gammaproteobacteria bacterium]
MIRSAALVASLVAGCAVAGGAADGWPIESGGDADSYLATSAIGRDSTSTIPDESGSTAVRPRLIFQCAAGEGQRLAARIDWKRFISSFNTDVNFRVDDRQRLWLKFGVDASNRITMTKSPADAALLVDYLAGSQLVKVGITPYAEAEVSVSFDLSGFDAALSALQSHCGND